MSDFPVFARHRGVWEGTYTLMDARTGKVLDRHESRLTCSMEGTSWQQENEYTWDDGRTMSRGFGGTFAHGALRFDTPRLKGAAWETDPDTIVLRWVYVDEDDDHHFSEIITLIDDNHRARTWQHFENGAFTKLTVIDERRVG